MPFQNCPSISNSLQNLFSKHLSKVSTEEMGFWNPGDDFSGHCQSLVTVLRTAMRPLDSVGEKMKRALFRSLGAGVLRECCFILSKTKCLNSSTSNGRKAAQTTHDRGISWTINLKHVINDFIGSIQKMSTPILGHKAFFVSGHGCICLTWHQNFSMEKS